MEQNHTGKGVGGEKGAAAELNPKGERVKQSLEGGRERNPEHPPGVLLFIYIPGGHTQDCDFVPLSHANLFWARHTHQAMFPQYLWQEQKLLSLCRGAGARLEAGG